MQVYIIPNRVAVNIVTLTLLSDAVRNELLGLTSLNIAHQLFNYFGLCAHKVHVELSATVHFELLTKISFQFQFQSQSQSRVRANTKSASLSTRQLSRDCSSLVILDYMQHDVV